MGATMVITLDGTRAVPTMGCSAASDTYSMKTVLETSAGVRYTTETLATAARVRDVCLNWHMIPGTSHLLRQGMSTERQKEG